MSEFSPFDSGETFTEANFTKTVPLGDLAIVSFDQTDGAPASIGFITEGGCCSSSGNGCN
jgi:hypothetical protein